jgi:signal transduction histidine kinase
MPHAPPDDPERIQALHRYQILDTAPEVCFDRLCGMAAELLRAPIAAIAFVNGRRTWFKSCRGVDLSEVSRETSFAGHAVGQDEVLALADARDDARFSQCALVAGPTAVRAFACAPLKTASAHRIGSLCVMDREIRQFLPEELRTLELLAGVVVDQLELRREALGAEPAAESARLAAGAMESAALGVRIADEEDRVVYVNPAYCALAGRSRAELIGSRCTALRAGAGHAGRVEEQQMVRMDGGVLDVHVTAARFTGESGRGFRVTTVADVTHLKRAEDQLRIAEKMEATCRFAGGVAHAFNNLLTIITGYSQLLRSELPAADPLAPYAEEISIAADRAAQLTGRLLAFSRHRYGEPERLDLNRVIEQMIGESLHTHSLTGIEFSADLAQGPALIIADKKHIEQAISDLAANAREAMPRGGRLAIRTSNVELAPEDARARGLQAGAYVVLTIEDTGQGIDPETGKHLFEPFYTTKGIGKGIGLATLYGTVKQSGGDITISSTPGRGTTVSVYLPAAR